MESSRLYLLRLKNLDVLKKYEPGQSEVWRRLDVAILQRYLLDEVLQPRFVREGELSKGYTADPSSIAGSVDGKKYQIALLLKPTPLSGAGRTGEAIKKMPQKSTYFYPKLATGVVMESVVSGGVNGIRARTAAAALRRGAGKFRYWVFGRAGCCLGL